MTDTPAYQVLARKYRPETFADLVGQDAMVRTLRNAFKADRIAQAFIMTGIRGTGKTTTARIIAKGMNCIGTDGQGGPTTDPCGQCEHCTAIMEGRHVDVMEMDAASRTGVGDIAEVVGMKHTVITHRPVPQGAASHYGRGRPEDPKGEVENEDFASMLCTFASGATGTFETSRTTIGPESQNAFEIYGTKGALAWNFERLNELQYYRHDPSDLNTGWTTIFGGDRFPYHGAFVPGQANAIGFEDIVATEDFVFLEALATGDTFSPGFAEAVDVVSVQQALINSWESRTWEPVTDLGASA